MNFLKLGGVKKPVSLSDQPVLAYPSPKKVTRIEFICNDLNLLDIQKFIKQKKINHYLNFAAIKHVRSEENLISAKYMLQTNSFNFIPKNLDKIKDLKTFFSISTDKAVNPSSLLGISKRIMELFWYSK